MKPDRPKDPMGLPRSSSCCGARKDSDKRQLAAIQEHAKRAGVEIVDTYNDAAVSGADPIDVRPGFAAMLERIEANGVRTIVVETANRFARDLMVQEVGFAMLRERDINLVAADSPTSFLDDTPTARLIPHAAAPRTLALLSGLPGIKVAAFARLAPGTLLPLHTHPEIAAEGLLQAHVTIKAPPPCGSCLLNVAGEIRQHVEGGLVVFDGSLPHWALNASGAERVILYLEFDRAAHHRPRAAPVPVETHGPMDVRAIGPAEVHPIASDLSRSLRAVSQEHGRRAGAAASFASILAGVTMLDETAGHGAVVDVLREHLGTAEKRVAEHAAGARREVMQ